MIKTIDEAHCPLCGKLNHCTQVATQNSLACWCRSAHVPSELLANPNVAHTKKCLCKCCIETFKTAQTTQ